MLQHRFVDSIPAHIEDNVLYISIPFCTAIHNCVCGSGKEVVTPLSPTDWQLTFDGKTVSLYPSIGNWNFDCHSHYFITKSKIEYARKWSDEEVEKGRRKDTQNKEEFYSSQEPKVRKAFSMKRRFWNRFKKKRK
ncbi:MAG TPA: DUF6527 family protein [Niabella sp.]|nr:DUF6527 family protein [Niabella sp.]HQX72539.1 DUF6527 family protein [Chitinophagaceae bacterium]HQW16272.1 DUF6527 family protein [Niabella sp.]HQX21496.1 DUF6527 family protein [Niabella sp.]HRB36090.1 DUF6527 family protein [Niabella sp.]